MNATSTPRIIVCGDDGSPHADRAWLWINNQVWPGFEAHIVSCVRRADDLSSGDNPHLARQPIPSRRHFAESQLSAVTSFVSPSHPCAALAQAPGDLLVVGPRGHSGLAALAMGSTAEHLLRKGGRPLVIAATPEPATRVVVCVDGSETSAEAAAFAGSLPLMGVASDVVVLGVLTSESPDDATHLRTGVAQAVELLAGANVRPMIVHGETTAPASILGICAELDANLVVAGTRGSNTVRRALLGSTTWSIARSGEITMLAVPPARDAAATPPAWE
jgi:nucleotide-binding universal stress UspA family protein